MARIKYYYDTETCKYERVKISKWDMFLNILGFLTIALIFALGIVLVYTKYFESPKERMLVKENEELNLYYQILSKEVEDANKMLSFLQKRDDQIYRTIFEADPIPASVRNAGVGGVERYRNILDKKMNREEMILGTFQKVDKLKKQMYIQTKSYDDLLQMANEKNDLWAAIPAIQPLANKELNRLASGFGMRLHPIYKVKMLHSGIDFAAPKGTPIYATGDGVVITVRTNLTGYGKEVEISHGYGYVTKYAHMSNFNVKVGQKVKRGECIGYVGNTGTSTAPHCHYEVIKDGKKVNPILYIFQDINEDDYEKLLDLASIENQSLGGGE
jgi:murein DD-endopeptidase MepM/ murein hydrolase activator NlpD